MVYRPAQGRVVRQSACPRTQPAESLGQPAAGMAGRRVGSSAEAFPVLRQATRSGQHRVRKPERPWAAAGRRGLLTVARLGRWGGIPGRLRTGADPLPSRPGGPAEMETPRRQAVAPGEPALYRAWRVSTARNPLVDRTACAHPEAGGQSPDPTGVRRPSPSSSRPVASLACWAPSAAPIQRSRRPEAPAVRWVRRRGPSSPDQAGSGAAARLRQMLTDRSTTKEACPAERFGCQMRQTGRRASSAAAPAHRQPWEPAPGPARPRLGRALVKTNSETLDQGHSQAETRWAEVAARPAPGRRSRASRSAGSVNPRGGWPTPASRWLAAGSDGPPCPDHRQGGVGGPASAAVPPPPQHRPAPGSAPVGRAPSSWRPRRRQPGTGRNRTPQCQPWFRASSQPPPCRSQAPSRRRAARSLALRARGLARTSSSAAWIGLRVRGSQ